MLASLLSLIIGLVSGCGAPAETPADATTSTDAAPACEPGVHDLVAPEDAPYRLQVAGEWIYWNTAVLDGPKRIRRAPRAGGAIETLVETTRELGAFAVDSDGAMYWVEVATTGAGQVMLQRPGQVAQPLYTIPTGLDAFAVAIDGTSVYWVVHGEAANGYTETVFGGVKSGGAAVMLGSVTLAFDQSLVAMAADGAGVYWGLGAGLVYRVARTGGTPTAVVDELDGIGAFAVADGAVYAIVRDAASSVIRVDGAGRGVVMANGQARWALGIADGRAYASTADDRILSAPITGGQVRIEQADGVRSAGGLAFDGDHLYWANTATRTADGAVRWACRTPEP